MDLDYNEVCSELIKAENELRDLQIDLFVLNPKVQKLTKKISELHEQKALLEKEQKENNEKETNLEDKTNE